jgi:hypothetical protein
MDPLAAVAVQPATLTAIIRDPARARFQRPVIFELDGTYNWDEAFSAG